MAVLPWTLLIFTYAIAIAFPIGHWLGKVAGWRSGEKGSAGLSIASVGLYTIFPPLLVFFLVVGVSGLTDNQGIGRLRALFNGGEPDPGHRLVHGVDVGRVRPSQSASRGLVLARSGRTIPRVVWVLAMILGPVVVWSGDGELG